MTLSFAGLENKSLSSVRDPVIVRNCPKSRDGRLMRVSIGSHGGTGFFSPARVFRCGGSSICGTIEKSEDSFETGNEHFMQEMSSQGETSEFGKERRPSSPASCACRNHAHPTRRLFSHSRSNRVFPVSASEEHFNQK